MTEEQALYLEAARRGSDYLAGVRDQPVFPPAHAVAALQQLGGPLPDVPTDPATVLRMLDEIGSPATVANSGGRYFGFVNGGALPVARAAGVLSLAWDQNGGLRVMSPVAATLEDISIGWMLDLLGLPAGSSCGFVTGATMASFTCLASARHALLARNGWDVEARGLFGAPEIRVVISEETHVSVLKALALAGLGRERVLTVPVDDQGRIRPDQLPPLDDRTIVCLQAGNVNSGSFDPFDPVCDAAHRAGAWVHVDGAFGLWAAACPQLAHLTGGMGRAHSWAADAHKWLNVPYDCGLAFVRDALSHRETMRLHAAYLTPDAGRDPFHWTPEASRRARGVEVWAALRSLGRAGLAAMIAETCRHARTMADGLRAAGYEVLNDVVLNQVLVSFGTPEATRRVTEGLQREGTCWCGPTLWQGRTAMRISVSSWATTGADVERTLAAMIEIAGRP